MSETDLLQAFRKERSEEAFAELVRRYAGLVYSVAKRRLGNAALAEDITQIVFIRFAKAPPPVDNHGQLVAWLHRTTLNVTIDTWRSETRRRNREQQAVAMEPTTVDWDEVSPKLDEALNQLNDQDRQALLLRFFGRKTMREVGAAFGVSEDAAKMRVNRAVDRLRTQMGVSAACTAMLLGTMLIEHSVEAAPSQLISRLAGMKLPAAARGTSGLLDTVLKTPVLKVTMGLIVIGLIAIIGTRLMRTSDVRPTALVLPIEASAGPSEKPKREAFDYASFNRTAGRHAKAVKIQFHVLDAETSAGLANTKIHYVFFGAGGQGESHEILTDNNGDAPIAEPDDSAKTWGPNVFVTAEEHVPKVVGFQEGAVPEDYILKLDPALTVGGIIVDDKGAPVPGVIIHIQNPGNKPGQIENVDFQTCPVTNRENGTWSCSYVPKDYTNEIRFELKKSGFAVTFPVVPVGRVDLTNLVLVIDRGFTITGRVTDLHHQGIRNADITIISGQPAKRCAVKTDAEGEFTLAGVPGDAAPNVLYQEPPLKTNHHGAVIIRGLAPITPERQLSAETERRIQTFLREDRAELSREKTLLENLKRVPTQDLAQAISNARVKDPQLYSLIEQFNRQEEVASLNAQTSRQDAQLQTRIVELSELKQKIDARAQNVLLEKEAAAAATEQGIKQLDEEYHNAIARPGGPAPLRADLAVQAPGFAPQTVSVDLLDATNVANFTLSRGNTFWGIVVDEAGNAIPYAVVQTDFDFKKQADKRFEWTTHTDTAGRFEWDSAPTQEICYWFEADGYEPIRGLTLRAEGDHRIVLRAKPAK